MFSNEKLFKRYNRLTTIIVRGAKSEKTPISRSHSTDGTGKVLWQFMKGKGCLRPFVVVILRSVQNERTSEVFVHGTLVCVAIATNGRFKGFCCAPSDNYHMDGKFALYH